MEIKKHYENFLLVKFHHFYDHIYFLWTFSILEEKSLALR